MNANELRLFALDASRAFGESVSASLAIPLSAHEEREFEDGEHKARPLVNVRGADAFVIHSLYGEAGQSANDKLVRLLLFIGALRDSAAGRVTAVIPYLAYARKDRKTKARDPVTTRHIACLFEAVGADGIVTLDVHNLAALQNAFRCRTENLEANALFVGHFASLLQDTQVAVVSPDAGGIKRVEQFRNRLADALGRPVGAAFAEKYRSAGVVSGEALVGDVGGKVAIIVDDLISAGTTIARAAQACREHGATRILAAASHGLFAGAANEVLAASVVEQIVVTDSVPPLRVTAPGLKTKLVHVSTASLFAEAIRRIHDGGSIVELLGA
jgi:ribose-phosphate pyrophosphokinase